MLHSAGRVGCPGAARIDVLPPSWGLTTPLVPIKLRRAESASRAPTGTLHVRKGRHHAPLSAMIVSRFLLT